MNERELIELTDDLVDDLVPMAGDAPDVCPVCRAGKGPRSNTCSSCATTLEQVAYPCRTIIPISYYTKPEEEDPPSPFRDAMHGYKDPELSPGERRAFSRVVGGVFARYLIEHGEALAEAYGGWDAIVTVPSTQTEPPSQLARLLTNQFSDLIDRPADWLGPGPGRMSWNRAAEDGFVPIVDVESAQVLLVDDTFTTGARMQSAAHALHAGGATVVAGIAVSRKIRVNAQYKTVDLWNRQSAQPFSFTDLPWWAA